MNLFKWLSRNVFNLLGGMFIGLSLPLGDNITSSQLIDFVLFCPIGVLLLAISYYYSFVDKS